MRLFCVVSRTIGYWLLALLLLVGVVARAEEPSVCQTEEPWGSSRYELLPEGGIRHYVKSTAGEVIARTIVTPAPATHCLLLPHALVFIVPPAGIFQIDRDFDSGEKPIRLAGLPGFWRQTASLVATNSELEMISGDQSSLVSFEVSVRNDVMSSLAPQQELDAKDMPPTSQLTPTIESLLSAAHSHERQQHPLEPTTYCASDDEVAVFSISGEIHRYRYSQANQSLLSLGRFQLDSAIRQCAIDPNLKRLYVITRSPVLWVFDLRQPSLNEPRSVTSDRILDSLTALTLYESEYVIAQSEGDHAILVFRTNPMGIVARFRIKADVPLGIDGVGQSDWLWASSAFSEDYPLGVLLVRDQFNRLPEAAENLKLIDWRSIEGLINDP